MSNNLSSQRVGRPPGADAERTKTEILDAALRAFADRGFDGASIREITGAVGVGHNLVRHYFGSKEDLWRAAMLHGLGPMSTAIVDLLRPDREDTPAETLRAGLEVVLSEAGSNPDAVRLLLSEALRGGPRFDEIYDEVMAPVGAVLVEYLRAVGDDLADVDPRVLGVFVFGAAFSGFAFEGLAARVGLRPPGPDGGLDGQSHQLIDMIVSGISRQP